MLESTRTPLERTGKLAPPRVASILGLGHRLPDRIVSNASIAERIGVDGDWIVRRTGIRERRFAGPDERTSDLAIAAARRALTDAGVRASEIDLILVATMTQDELTPNTGPLVAAALGLQVGAFDIGSACTGWLTGLSIAASQVESGRSDRVLLVGAETLSRITDHDDKRTAAIFGDGAGAVVIGPDGEGMIGPVQIASDGAVAELIVATHDDRVLVMDGHATFVKAVRALVESIETTLQCAGVAVEEVDHFVFHQANARILKAVAERLSLPLERVANYIGETGNTSAASIPITLSLLREDGRLRAGQRLMFGACGAGFTWGTGLVDWGLR